MAFVIIMLTFVVIIRFSITVGYSSTGWPVPYGLISGFSVFLLADITWGVSLVFGLLSAIGLWIWLRLMDWFSETWFFWWPLLVSGLLMPVWLLMAIAILVS